MRIMIFSLLVIGSALALSCKQVNHESIESGNNVALYNYIENGDVANVNRLINEGVDLNSVAIGRGVPPIVYAIGEKKVDIIRLLYKHGAGFENSQVKYSELLIYTMIGDINKVNDILKAGYDINEMSIEGSPIVFATDFGNIEMVEFLINKGADVDTWRWTHVTPLMIASSNGSLEITKLLVRNGADVNAYNTDGGETPLQYACDNNHVQVANYLIDMGSNINHNNGQPLREATKAGSYEAVVILIQRGALVNLHETQIGFRCETALIDAVEKGNIRIAELLLKNGADTNIRDRDGLSAFDIAKKMKNKELIDLLDKYGAKE